MAATQLKVSKDGEEVPESFICALTGEVMTDPVIDTDGNTYERAAIEQWLAKSATSPLTRAPLHTTDLVPNRALRDAIAQWRSSRVAPAPAAATTGSSTTTTETATRVEVGVTAGEEGAVLVRMSMAGPASRSPADVVCVLDVSGSMADEATVQNAAGSVESHGLSLLDVVKHTVGAVVEALRATDRLAIVSFSSTARVELGLTRMDVDGKKLAASALSRLVPEGSTNLWDGLYKALELLRAAGKSAAVPNVLLYTDGIPNVEPPRGHVPMLRRYRETSCRGTLPGAVHTFGFGYSLDSKLLAELASEGGGAFNFIPDAGLVGTVFVNATANLLSTGAKDVVLTLQPLNGATFAESAPIGWPAAAIQQSKTQGELCVGIGTIQHGQARDVVVRMKGMPPVGTPFLRAHVASKCGDVVVEGVNHEAVAGEIGVQLVRCTAVDLLRKVIPTATSRSLEAARLLVAEFVDRVRHSPAIADARVVALLEDLDGQVMQSLSRQDWFDRWGKHYLPSLAGAHLLQQANNFKDPGVQRYGGPLFASLRDEIDEIFVHLPPPTPSAHRRPPSPTHPHQPRQPLHGAAPGAMKQAAASPRVVDMHAYMDASGGCFAGQCNVQMADGTQRRVDSIKRGDVLADGAKVICVVRTTCAKGTTSLVALGDLLITPWHPVNVDGVWRFPRDIASETLQERACGAVFTFVLDSVHSAIVCGVRCVTLAHGAVGDIREHAYYGTQRVLDDLKAMSGWENGLVELAPEHLLRDTTTHRVRGIIVNEC